jgi:DNA-binding beta-propeller fold protein YncE
LYASNRKKQPIHVLFKGETDYYYRTHRAWLQYCSAGKRGFLIVSLLKKSEKSDLSATHMEKHFTEKKESARFHAPRKSYILALLVILAITPLFFLARGMTGARADSAIHHYFYVFPDHELDVYDMDNNFQLVQQISLPMTDGGRGIIADPASGSLYLSYHGDGGIHGTGSLLKYNLLTNTIVWTQNYPFGIDSGAISPDGKTIYMPDGEAAYDGTWHVINASDGSVAGSIFTTTGNAAHNTIVGFTGKHVYLGGLNNSTFFAADTSTNKITTTIPNMKGGVRPFTINGSESLVFTTHTGFLGFQVSDLNAGKILYTVPVNGFSAPAGSTSAHGISISPDEKELYLIDTPNSYVHVFDISGLPATAPKQVADIKLSQPMTGAETPCIYDCGKEGWLLHIGDGRYVVVGDSGDIIDTTTRTVAYHLDSVNNTRKFLEVDWQNGQPIFTTTRQGMGYVGVPASTAKPTPITPGLPTATPIATATSTPLPTPTATTPTPTGTSTPLPTPTTTATVTPTPGPGTTLAQDNFQRASQNLWGKASDGQTWGGDANTQAAFTIHDDVGQIANGSGPYNAVLGASATNAEVLFTGSMSSFTNNNLGAVLRWQNTNNWYKAYINGTSLVIQARVNGTTTTLTQAAFPASANTAYNLRFRVVGTTLYAKAWVTTATEPAAWTATTTNSSLSSGQCGLRTQVLGATSASITSFQATTAS